MTDKSMKSRRGFLQTVATALVAAPVHFSVGSVVAPRVVVVGGGFGGAACARYLKKLRPALDVVLIERSRSILTCPFSNLVVAGMENFDALSQNLEGLRQHGVRIVEGEVVSRSENPAELVLKDGSSIRYDRAVVSPGIELMFDSVPGYSKEVAEKLPHAWRAGSQTVRLRDQINTMRDGGVVVIVVPANPYRCPPGPYERASLIANYLARAKPRSKVLILDAKDNFSKKNLFVDAWQRLYPGFIDWVAGSAGGLVHKVDGDSRKVWTQDGFTEHTADVVNVIPPQRAGTIAFGLGLADSTGWCPVDNRTFESTLVPKIHVLGDAVAAGDMPKSAFSANSQAKVCAAAIVCELSDMPIFEPTFLNTCYSFVAPDYGISTSGIYSVTSLGIREVPGSGGESPQDASLSFRRAEARYAKGWYRAITSDTWS